MSGVPKNYPHPHHLSRIAPTTPNSMNSADHILAGKIYRFCAQLLHSFTTLQFSYVPVIIIVNQSTHHHHHRAIERKRTRPKRKSSKMGAVVTPSSSSPRILFLNPMIFPPADNTNSIATHPLRCFQALFSRRLSHIPGPSYSKTFISIRWATRDRFFESTTNPSASRCHPQCETDATRVSETPPTESECPFFGFAHRNHLLIRSRQGLVFVAASMYT